MGDIFDFIQTFESDETNEDDFTISSQSLYMNVYDDDCDSCDDLCDDLDEDF